MKPHSEPVRKDLIVPKKKATMGYATRRVGLNHTVSQEVKDWLKVMITNHWYLYECRETRALRIAFHNHNDAMKYKLVWH